MPPVAEAKASSRNRRQAYGLTIDSELDLPELLPATVDTGVPADIVIRFGSVSADGLDPATGAKRLGPYLCATADSFWLQIPEVARFLVQSGTVITIDPAPGIDDDSLRVFLLGSAIGALLFQRGYLVLHGNAIRIGDQCMVCVGPSGAGKSTLAAAFLQRGHSILADDVVPIDDACRAIPGFPRIKLWKDTAGQLSIETSALRRIRPELEKFNVPLTHQFATEPLPVRWVYMLRSASEPGFEITPVTGMDRFLPLRANTYRMSFLKGMGLNGEHLKLVGKLAGRIHLADVRRPKQGFELDALIDHILADIAAHP